MHGPGGCRSGCSAAGVLAATISLVGLAGCTFGLDPLGHWERVDCLTQNSVDIERLCWVDDTYSAPEVAASDIESWAEDQFKLGLRVNLGDCFEVDDTVAYRCEMTLSSDESDEEVATVVVRFSPHGDPTYSYLIVPVLEIEAGP